MTDEPRSTPTSPADEKVKGIPPMSEAELRELGAERQEQKVKAAQEREVDYDPTDPRHETPEEAWARDPKEAAARTPAGGQLKDINLPGQPPSLSESTKAEMQAGKEALERFKAGREEAKEARHAPPPEPDPDAPPRNPNSLPDLPRLPDHDAEDASFALQGSPRAGVAVAEGKAEAESDTEPHEAGTTRRKRKST